MSVLGVGESLHPDAVDVNAAGRLDEQQRSIWRGRSRGIRVAELQFAGLFTAIGVLVLLAPGPANNAAVKPLAAAASLLLAALLLLRALTGTDSVTDDVRRGLVESVQGPLSKHVVSGRTESSYFIDVARRRLRIWRDGYESLPDAGIVRVFFLPRSHRVVNVQRLPDPAVATPSLDSAHALFSDMLTARHAHDETAMAEKRAELGAMQTQLQRQIFSDATPPANMDATQLSESIAGTWTNPLATITFNADGSLRTTIMGRERDGHWSIDSAGMLHSDAFGSDEAAQAWITDGELTVNATGRSMRFARAAG
jgi:hypothetical protein